MSLDDTPMTGDPLGSIIVPIALRKRIALVAHDNKKRDLVEWARFNHDVLAEHELLATGTTGEVIEQEVGVPVRRLQSGPLGGDLQIGALITTGDVDFLVFFWDPLEPHPHDPDVKALLRIAVVWNIPIACNRATADFLISSALMRASYDRLRPDYDEYLRRLAAEDLAVAAAPASRRRPSRSLGSGAAGLGSEGEEHRQGNEPKRDSEDESVASGATGV
jgi:methylglyoxal synthase